MGCKNPGPDDPLPACLPRARPGSASQSELSNKLKTAGSRTDEEIASEPDHVEEVA